MLRRHARGRAHKLERQPELCKKVLQRLAAGWSPEQIAGRMAQGPGSDRISYESIYRYIYWRSPSTKRYIAGCLAKSTVAESVCPMADGRRRPSWTGLPFMIARPWWKPERAPAIGKPTS